MSAKTSAFIGGTLIDGYSEEAIEESVVLVKGPEILEVGQKDSFKLPVDCEIIDITDKTVLPGLIDLHTHVTMGQHDLPAIAPGGGFVLPSMLSRSLPWFSLISYAHAKICLGMGFTTLRDPAELIGGYATVALREAISRGVVEGPRIFTAGPVLTTTGGHVDFWPLWISRDDMPSVTRVDGVDECRRAVRERVKMGTDWIKIFGSGGIMNSYNKCEFANDELKTIVEEAHAKERRVSAHLMYPEGVIACVKAGVDTVEHGSILTDECIDLMLENKTVLVPTLYAVWSIANQGKEFGLADEYIKTMRKNLYEPHIESFRKAYEAGVKIAMGTDCGFQPCPHGTNAKELELMMKFSGMTAMEAIQISTKNAAAALGIDEKVGTVTKGKLADLVVIDGNPIEDICVLQDRSKIVMVMKEGHFHVKREKID